MPHGTSRWGKGLHETSLVAGVLCLQLIAAALAAPSAQADGSCLLQLPVAPKLHPAQSGGISATATNATAPQHSEALLLEGARGLRAAGARAAAALFGLDITTIIIIIGVIVLGLA